MPKDLPPTVAPEWRPRPPEWVQRAPSPFEGMPGRPVFVGACPRSGTTLLRLMLDNHPDMAVPQETNFVRPLWWRRVQFGDLRDAANRRRVAEWIFTDRDCRGGRLRGGEVSRKEAIARVADAPPTVGGIVQACLELYAQTHAKPRWGDKRPAYSGFIPALFAMFPHAQYVNVVRDPRSASASQIPMGWDEPAVAFPAAVARWEASIERTDRFARALRPDQLLDVRYEDLVTDPHGTLRRVCEFTGLRDGDAIDAMVAAERRADYGGTQERLTGPVTTASIERWRERLSAEQIALVEQAAAPHLDRLGYRPAPDVTVAPEPAEARELDRQRRIAQRKWRISQGGELLRRLRYRRPVATPASSGGASGPRTSG